MSGAQGQATRASFVRRGERRVGGEGRGVRSRLVGDRRAEERGHGRATRAHSVRANGGRALPQPALERAVRTDSDEQARTDTDRERPGFAAAALERRGARDSALAVAYAPPCLTRCTVELGTRSPDLRGLRYGRARGAKAIRGARSSAAARVTCARRWTWTRRRVVRDGGGGVTSGRWRRGLVMLETRAGSLIALVGAVVRASSGMRAQGGESEAGSCRPDSTRRPLRKGGGESRRSQSARRCPHWERRARARIGLVSGVGWRRAGGAELAQAGPGANGERERRERNTAMRRR
ncbi:hypothetical protein B0H15DRAFT_144689 [Mycena belliarum]|uniref:Uncharacterized protein n=1 Tax=Mycena belliarum TaxID=1033014 RepID=A0AAD6XRC2_9AGAR|nr:hypothetical protein B0H15DRAFT_144689 [Mycena belliae]